MTPSKIRVGVGLQKSFIGTGFLLQLPPKTSWAKGIRTLHWAWLLSFAVERLHVGDLHSVGLGLPVV